MAELNLQRFCATERDTRVFMRAPGRRGEFVYATNGYLAVRVPAADLPSAAPFPDDVLLHMPALFDCIDKVEGLTWTALPPVIEVTRCRRCKGACRLRVETCESCDGEGEFERDGYTYDCKACEGEGFNEVHEDGKHVDCPQCGGNGHERGCGQDLDPGNGQPKVHVSAGYLSWLARLPGVVMAPQAPDQVTRFKFDGGHALLMPERR